MYQPYADAAYYRDTYGGQVIPEEDIEKVLKKASRHVDSLTYNRLVGRGIASLTEFQSDIVREVCCEMAEFEYENAELLESVLKRYSINGVSVDFGESWNLKVVSGIPVQAGTYQKLMQTGLCHSGLRGRW